MVIAKFREILAVGKQAAKVFYRQRFNPRKLNELEVRKQYQTEITNRFAALENLKDYEGVNRTWENIKENIKTSAKESPGLHELKQHKPWFDEECLSSLDQRKRVKIQWVQDPSQSNLGNLNNVRREVSKHFRNKKMAYLRVNLRNLKLTVRSKTLGTCIWASLTLRSGTSLDVI